MMDELLEILAFIAYLCSGTTHCSVIPKPLHQSTYLVEICKDRVDPEFRDPRQIGNYTIESVIKPNELCSFHNRPNDYLDDINRWEEK